jgi:hypothetical protein
VPVKAVGDISPTSVTAEVHDGTHVLTTTTLVPETDGFGGELGVLPCSHWYLPTCGGRYTVVVVARVELPGGLVLLSQEEAILLSQGEDVLLHQEAVVKVRWQPWQDAAGAMLIIALVGAIWRLVWRCRQKLLAAWCWLQIRRLKATQALIKALQRNRLIPAVLPAARLRRWREGLRRWHRRSSQQYARLGVEPLYAGIHREGKRIGHQDLRSPGQLIRVRKTLDGLRPVPLDQLEARIRSAETASHIAGGQVAYFEKWLDVGRPVMAMEWLKKLATSCLQNEQIAAGWCLVRLVEAGKWDLYFELYREGQIPYHVYEYETRVERFIVEGEWS